MATKIDDEMVDDARKENKEFVKKNGHANGQNTGTNQNNQNTNSNTSNSSGDNKQEENSNSEKKEGTDSKKDQNTTDQNGQQNNFDFTNQAQGNEFEEKFNEFFKNNPLIAGTTAVNLVDDLKANFFMVYAKKNGVDMPKEAFAMDAKTKEFTAFLVDHAIKGKMFDWVKKYPLVAALGVFGLSAGTTFLMIKMLASEKNEKEEMAEKIKVLERKLWEEKKAKAETVEPIVEEKKSEESNVKEFINSI